MTLTRDVGARMADAQHGRQRSPEVEQWVARLQPTMMVRRLPRHGTRWIGVEGRPRSPWGRRRDYEDEVTWI